MLRPDAADQRRLLHAERRHQVGVCNDVRRLIQPLRPDGRAAHCMTQRKVHHLMVQKKIQRRIVQRFHKRRVQIKPHAVGAHPLNLGIRRKTQLQNQRSEEPAVGQHPHPCPGQPGRQFLEGGRIHPAHRLKNRPFLDSHVLNSGVVIMDCFNSGEIVQKSRKSTAAKSGGICTA